MNNRRQKKCQEQMENNTFPEGDEYHVDSFFRITMLSRKKKKKSVK